MNYIYITTLPERIWHWINAALFIALALTGLLMHASENLESISLGDLIAVHNVAAVLFVVNMIFWLIYQVASGRIRHYFKVEKDIISRLTLQAKFYLIDILSSSEHPFPVSEDSKFNPLQRLTYIGLMFVLLPLQIVSGWVLHEASEQAEILANLEHFRTIALTHTALSYLLMSFLVGHIYLATTGDRPLSLLKSMISGYHEEHVERKEDSEESA